MKARLLALAGLFFLAFATLAGRTAWLQVVHGEEYARKAVEGTTHLDFVPATRGPILDRKGRPLAEDVAAYRLVARLDDLDPGCVVPAKVAALLREPRAAHEARWRELARGAAGEARDPGKPSASIALASIPLSVPRKLVDRIVRATDGLSFDGTSIRATPALLRQREDVLERVGRLAGADGEALLAKCDAAAARALAIPTATARARRLGEPIPLVPGVPFDVVARVEEDARLFPGISVELVPERRYPQGSVAAHVIGTVGAPEPRAVEALGGRGKIRDRFGTGGLEAARNVVLAGRPGARLAEWNPRTREYEVLADDPSTPGAAVRTTIDIDHQRAAEAALDEAVARFAGPRGGGAAVLLDARTGEVYALATAPRYDPARLRIDFALLADPDGRHPLLHRAIAAELPPGSIMKPLTAAAGLEAGVITRTDTIPCAGALFPGRRGARFRCNGHHYDIDLPHALAHSCNVFFYRVGERLGEDPLVTWAEAFGLGSRTGIELGGERPGLVPSGAWKAARHEAQRKTVAAGAERRLRAAADAAAAALLPGLAGRIALAHALGELDEREERLRRAVSYLERTGADRAWTQGDNRLTAIGQGNLCVTPLQAARLAAALASGGRLVRPRIVLESGAPPAPRAEAGLAAFGDDEDDGDLEAALDPIAAHPEDLVEVPDFTQMAVSPATWAAIRAGMVECVTGGTAKSSGLAAYGTAAKTGTAEAPGGSHAWIIGYSCGPWARGALAAGAPVEAEVAFAVVIESVADRLHGGEVAGPAAAAMLKAYFGERRR